MCKSEDCCCVSILRHRRNAAASDRTKDEHQREIVPVGFVERNHADFETARSASMGLTSFATVVRIIIV